MPNIGQLTERLSPLQIPPLKKFQFQRYLSDEVDQCKESSTQNNFEVSPLMFLQRTKRKLTGRDFRLISGLVRRDKTFNRGHPYLFFSRILTVMYYPFGSVNETNFLNLYTRQEKRKTKETNRLHCWLEKFEWSHLQTQMSAPPRTAH